MENDKIERNKKTKLKWYDISRLTLKGPKKGEESAGSVANKTIAPKNLCNQNSQFFDDRSNDHRSEMQPEMSRFKNIPFRVMLNRKASSLDDLCLSNALQRRESEENSLVLFLRSILPDLQKMNAAQIHQFRTQTLNTIGDILFGTKNNNRSDTASSKILNLNKRKNLQSYRRRPAARNGQSKLSTCFSDSMDTLNHRNRRKCSYSDFLTSDRKACLHSNYTSPESYKSC